MWHFSAASTSPLAEAKISVMTHAFNYGTGTFEGIRGYWNAAEEQIYVFRMREHFERLHNSARILAIDLPYSVDELGAICLEVLRRSGFRADVYIRPIAYKSGLGIGVSMTGVADAFVMYCPADGQLHRHRARHQLLRQFVAPQQRQRHPAACQDHRLIHQLGAGQARGAWSMATTRRSC